MMNDNKLVPKPITDLSELEVIDGELLAAIVISTALSSKVKLSYCQVLEFVTRRFPRTPIFLASFTNFRRTQVVVNAKLKEAGIPFVLRSLTEAADQKSVDWSKEVVVITKEDLADDSIYPQTMLIVKSLLSKESITSLP